MAVRDIDNKTLGDRRSYGKENRYRVYYWFGR